MKKQTKQKIKNYSLKTLHILGYISIFIVVLMSILLGVTQCNKKDDHINNNSEISLNNNYPSTRRSIDINNMGYSTLYNITDSGEININANDLYLLDMTKYRGNGLSDFYVYFYNLNGDRVNCGMYISYYSNINSQPIGVYKVFNRILFQTNRIVCIDSSNHEWGIYSSDYLFFVFEDSRIISDGGRTRYNHDLQMCFNGFFTYVDVLSSSQTHGSEYLSLDLNYYLNFINTYFVRPFEHSYLFPFVLPLSELYNSYPSQYKLFPIVPFDTNDSAGYWFDIIDSFEFDRLLSLYSRDYGDEYPSYLYSAITKNEYGQYLLSYSSPVYSNNQDHTIIAGGFGYKFQVHVGGYRFHNFFKNFLSYSFVYDNVWSQFSSKYVYTSLSYTFNAFYLYRYYEENYPSALVGRSLDYFRDSYIYVNGQVKLNCSFRYIDDYSRWVTLYYNSSTADGYYDAYSHPGMDANNPVFKATLYYANYNRIVNSLNFGYQPQLFTALTGYYDTDFIFELESGGHPDISSPTSMSSSGLDGVFSLLTSAFDGISSIFNISIFGYLTIGTIVFLPLVITLILAIIRLFKR